MASYNTHQKSINKQSKALAQVRLTVEVLAKVSHALVGEEPVVVVPGVALADVATGAEGSHELHHLKTHAPHQSSSAHRTWKHEIFFALFERKSFKRHFQSSRRVGIETAANRSFAIRKSGLGHMRICLLAMLIKAVLAPGGWGCSRAPYACGHWVRPRQP
jgi:hypothetical protein